MQEAYERALTDILPLKLEVFWLITSLREHLNFSVKLSVSCPIRLYYLVCICETEE